jgi:glycine C-acetyltransferase
MTLHEDLEAALAEFKQTEAVLTFQSGFTANTGVIPTITDERDLIVSDALNHASIIDGMRLSKAPRVIYPHRDVEALRGLLAEAREHGRADGTPHRLILVVTDGVFSMTGTSPLPPSSGGRGMARRCCRRRSRPGVPGGTAAARSTTLAHGRPIRSAR